MTPVHLLRRSRGETLIALFILTLALAFPAPAAAGESPLPSLCCREDSLAAAGESPPPSLCCREDSLAAADECRLRTPGKNPEVTFALQTSPTTWHTDQTRDQIRALRANSGVKVAAVGPNWQSIGLTLATFVLAVDVRVVATPINPPRSGAAQPEYCARLIAADVKFGTTRTDAYVARDYRLGTCPHRVVRGHEERHVAINRAAVERFAPLVESRLRAAARELPLVRAANAKAAAERLRKILHDDLARIFDAMGREMETENRALDTPEAYAAERKLCPLREW